MPVRNSAASLARNTATAATSRNCENRPKGIVARNLARFSGVSGPPINWVSKLVSPMTGQIALTRIFSGPSSTAIDLEMMFTAPFAPLYQVRPGRGRMPAVEPTLRITPRP